MVYVELSGPKRKKNVQIWNDYEDDDTMDVKYEDDDDWHNKRDYDESFAYDDSYDKYL